MTHDANMGPAPAWPELPEGRPRTSLDLAAAKLRAALHESAGYVLVTAENTRVAEALFLRIEPDLAVFRSLRVSGRTLDPDAVVRALWAKVEPTTAPPRAAVRLLLDRARTVGRPIIVALADADDVNAADVERLRTTLEAAPDAAEIVRIVLLGGPGLVELLRGADARAIAVRIGASINVPTATSALATAASTPPEDEGATRRLSIGGLVALAALVGVGALVAIAIAIAWMSMRPALQYDPKTVAQRDVTPPLEAPPPPIAAAVEPPAVAEKPAPVPEPEAVAPSPPAVAAAPEPEAAPVAKLETPEPDTPEPEAPVTLLAAALQVGAFRGRERAEALRKQLEGRYPHVTVSPMARDGETLYRVRVGGFRSEQDLGLAAAALRTDGYQPMRIRP